MKIVTLKFSRVDIASREFNMMMADIKKAVVFDKISHDNGKYWRYVTGYQKKILLFLFL